MSSGASCVLHVWERFCCVEHSLTSFPLGKHSPQFADDGKVHEVDEVDGRHVLETLIF